MRVLIRLYVVFEDAKEFDAGAVARALADELLDQDGVVAVEQVDIGYPDAR